ncbi:MAG: DUF4129 domain-containing protein [Bryobacteraceae bacterium]
MADSLAETASAQVCEDGMRLLRQAPLETLLRHWVGSVPFALALLAVWSDITQPRFPDLRCALETLLLALVWIWMHCWRAVFAGRLRRQLSGGPPAPWTGRRIWRLVLAQSFVAGGKLVILPLALLSLVPFARAVSAYRYAAVLGDREDLDALALSAASRRLGRIHTRLGWSMMAPLLLFRVVALFNVALTLAVLPQLVRLMTGYESSFSRGGVLFIANPFFVLLAFTATWLVTDPLVQAVYTVRCFQAESLETGEDVLAGLRRIRSLAAAAVLLLACACSPLVGQVGNLRTDWQSVQPGTARPPRAEARSRTPSRSPTLRTPDFVLFGLNQISDSSAPGRADARLDRLTIGPQVANLPHTAQSSGAVPPAELDRAVRRAAESPAYNWRFPPPASAVKGTPWIVAVTDRVLDALKSGLRMLGKAIGKILDFIFGPLLKGPAAGEGKAPARTLNRSLYVLIALAAGLAVWFLWHARQKRKSTARRQAPSAAVAVPLEEGGLGADRLPENEWLEMGERYLREDNPRLALRAFYLASLAWMGQNGWLALHAAKTNREYEVELHRKARAYPAVREPFAANMLAFERAWYGQHAVLASDVAEFRDRLAGMKRLLAPPEVAA